MPDSKITALTALTSADPANDMFPIVDVSDTSMAASGTTKRISINNLLAASGTATLASATITGDLTVDTSTLKVDSANNRVGIGTASPAVLFHAALPAATFGEVGRFYDSSGNGISFTANAGSGFNQITSTGAQPLIVNVNSSERYRITSDGVATWSNVGGVAGTAMTLNATGLGVGVSPAYKLDVQGADNSIIAQFGGVGGRKVNFTTSANGGFANGFFNFVSTSSVGAFSFQNTTGTLLTIDNGGNVGIGVTPLYRFHVKSDLSELYFRDNGIASELLINSETGGKSALYFGDVADTVRGGIVYDSATDSLDIRGYNNVARLQIDSVGNVVSNVTATAPTLSTNSQMVFNLTSNTNLRISVRGTDGVTRTANITLA